MKAKWKFISPVFSCDEKSRSASIELVDDKGFLKTSLTLSAYPTKSEIRAARMLVKAANQSNP